MAAVGPPAVLSGSEEWLRADINVRICRTETDKRRHWRSKHEDIFSGPRIGRRSTKASDCSF